MSSSLDLVHSHGRITKMTRGTGMASTLLVEEDDARNADGII
jgi:hypothetical protein